MTDLATPFSQSSDYQTPTPGYETPLGVNEPNTSEPSKVIYKTPAHSGACCFSYTFFIAGLIPTGVIVFLCIKEKNPYLIFISFFAVLISTTGFIIGTYFSIYFIISIDPNTGFVVLKSRKPFFCFNRTKTIGIKDIQQVSVETDKSFAYSSGNITYYSFKIIFKLQDGKEIVGCSGTKDKDNSGRNAFNTIRKGLPQNIPVLLNLETNYNNFYFYQ